MNGRTLAAALSAGLMLAILALAPPARAAEPPSAFASTTIDLGMVVSDVNKSVKFYTEALGFSELAGFKVPGDYAKQVGLTDGAEELDIHVLVLGDRNTATKLKLMQFKTAPKKSDTEGINSQYGFRYLTIYVHDTTAAVERLKKFGAKPLAGGPQGLPKGLPEGIFLTLVRDPDGNFVELVGPKK